MGILLELTDFFRLQHEPAFPAGLASTLLFSLYKLNVWQHPSLTLNMKVVFPIMSKIL